MHVTLHLARGRCIFSRLQLWHCQPAYADSGILQIEAESLAAELAETRASRAADKQAASTALASMRSELQASQLAEQAREDELNALANAREVVVAELAGVRMLLVPKPVQHALLCWSGNVQMSAMASDAMWGYAHPGIPCNSCRACQLGRP